MSLRQYERMKKPQIMLDLETLGKRPGSVIRAIGAVKFGGGAIGDSFYRRIDIRSAEKLGLKLDGETVLWWLQQDDAARAEMALPGEPILDVLREFSVWIGDTENSDVWGNSTSFDNALLAEAYALAELPLPWRIANERCYRTIRALNPKIAKPAAEGRHHAGLDARRQALHAMLILGPDYPPEENG